MTEREQLEDDLRAQQDPLLAALATAPLDDEEVTEEDRAALREAEADLTAGRTVSTDELRRRFAFHAPNG
jgi:hypothetical protein